MSNVFEKGNPNYKAAVNMIAASVRRDPTITDEDCTKLLEVLHRKNFNAADFVDIIKDGRAAASIAVVPAPKPEWDPARFIPFRERGYKDVEFLLEGVLLRYGINCVVAGFSHGKTFLIGDWIKHISQGKRWIGRKTIETPVWILDHENPAGVITSMMNALDIRDDKPGLFDHPIIWNCGEDAMQITGVDDPILIKRLEACEPDKKPLIVFDGLRAFLRGNENDAEVVRAFWEKCRELTNRRATLLFHLHNNRKGEYSGSTDLGAGVDAFWKLTSVNYPRLDNIVLEPLKVRGLSVPRKIEARMSDEDHGFVAVKQDPAKLARDAKLGDLLRQHPEGMTYTAFRTLASDPEDKIATWSQIADFVQQGITLGWIKPYTEGVGKRPAKKLRWVEPPAADADAPFHMEPPESVAA